MKFKRHSKTVYKKHDEEHYVFKNGIATVPGVRYKRKPMTITLKEFNELTKEGQNGNDILSSISSLE